MNFSALDNLGNKKSAVGPDGISYTLLKHLPDSWVRHLHIIINKCWHGGNLPSVWKTSIIIPILKQGKPRKDIASYRPIALTSHVSKVMEKIILNRLSYYCDKNNVIPSNQAGFKKGRSTADHLVKLSTNIKQQFARRKGVLATFFDIRKAYDRVWHERLLYKIKSIGLSGYFYSYIKNFLCDRKLMVKVKNSYSSKLQTNMGIPQGSIISPILFNILISDLPTKVSNKFSIVQYADDIALWINVNMNKKTSLFEIKFIQKIYQSELNNISDYMQSNGLEFSSEKTNMILLSNCHSPKILPKFYIAEQELNYVNELKFLGVYFTSKLNWKKHIDYLLQKAIKSFYLLKIISSKIWGQDTKILIHLACSLIRSKLSYGQEVFFSAPKTYLNKLQSLDSKAIKVALGVPVHTNTSKVYRIAGLSSLNDSRKLACAKYIIRSNVVDNYTESETVIQSHLDFPKRARGISSLQTISSFTYDLLNEAGINPTLVSKIGASPVPPWELNKPNIDIFDTDLTKSEHPYLVAWQARQHINSKYSENMQVFTDGSVLEDNNAGAGFVIPAIHVQKSFHLGKGYSVFTAELVAVVMALNTLINIPKNFISILLCVDSQSVLKALKSQSHNDRSELIFEIKHLIHSLTIRGTVINMCWIPSHCGFKYNDIADQLAKLGAKNDNAIYLNIPLSKNEMTKMVEHSMMQRLNLHHLGFSFLISHRYSRHEISLAFRLMLNAWKTKFCKNIICMCSEPLSIEHLLFHCDTLKPFLPVDFRNLNNSSNILFDHWLQISSSLIKAPVGQFL